MDDDNAHWRRIKEQWLDLAEFLKTLNKHFGKLGKPTVKRWPDGSM